MKFPLYILPFAVFLLSAQTAHAAASIETGFIKQNAYETQHYRIEFSDLIMDQEDSDRDGLANIIETVAEAAEYSREVLIEDLRYDDPMPDGEKLIIILDDNGHYLSESAIGVTSFLSNGDLYVAVDAWLPFELLEVTIGHELFHTVQFGYGADFAYSETGVKWAESTATWVEDIEYDSSNDYVNYLSDFFDYPDYSVFASVSPTGTLFEYALNIWPRFLSEYYDNSIVKQIWDAYIASTDSFDSDLKLYGVVKSVVEARGDDLNEVFRQFTLWNLDLSKYEEGENYPDLFTLQGETSESYQEINNSYAPALFGANYIYFENSNDNNSFYLHLQKPEGVAFAVTLVPYEASGFTLTRSTSVIVGAEELMDSALELSSLAGKDGVVAVISPLERDFTLIDKISNFDKPYSYKFFAHFGSDGEDLSNLLVINSLDVPSTGVKEGDVSTGDKGTVLPDTLSLSLVGYDEDSVSFKWNRLVDSEIDSYELNYGEDAENLDRTQVISHVYTTSAMVKDLKEDHTYYFELQGLDVDGQVVGDPTALLTVTPKTWLFSDLSYVGSYYTEVSALVDAGILKGYSDGTFKPDATINRAELLKILIEGKEGTPSSDYKNCFTDVKTDWYAPYVCYAKEQDWVSGYSDGGFRPGQTVSKVEALKMLFEVYGVELNEGQSVSDLPYADLNTGLWYSVYVKEASDLGILEETPGTDFEGGNGRTRGEMALELYRYLVLNDLIGN